MGRGHTVRIPAGSEEVHQGYQDGFRGAQEAGGAEGSHRLPQGGDGTIAVFRESEDCDTPYNSAVNIQQIICNFDFFAVRKGVGCRGCEKESVGDNRRMEVLNFLKLDGFGVVG